MLAERAAQKQAALRDQQIGQIFRALSDPTRRKIVERLAAGSASMTELAQPFDMALPSVAQHLGELERCHLVRSEKQGRVRRYELVAEPLQSVEHWLFAQRAAWEQCMDRMQDFVEQQERARRGKA